MTTSAGDTLDLPRPPQQPAPYRFPAVAAVAPVVLAVIVFLVTASPFALAFAALGPVTAVAGYVDSRWSARRLRRDEARRFAADSDTTRRDIARRHEAERSALFEVTPDPARLLDAGPPDPHRWRASAAAPIPVAIGIGTVASALRVDAPPASTPPTPQDSELRALVARARELRSAPVVVDARLGIGVCGPDALARAIARGVAVQLARAFSPAAYWRAGAASADGTWFDHLPHESGAPTVSGSFAEFGARGEHAIAVVAVAGSPAQLPGACRVVIGADEEGVRVLGHPDPEHRRLVRPLPLSRVDAATICQRLDRDAAREGITSPHARLPHAVELTPLLRPVDHSGLPSLACELGAAADSTVTVDLVQHGPHAVIGGTTGSGKSELLIAWVLAMASSRSPQQVTFLLVDYKGGATFASLEPLPHTVGIITDLDASTAERALASLRAEVRHRERLLVESGARSVDEVDNLPRLVIVVDEFAAMLADHPDLHALFADLAARGRSLGIHLILCTQRPAGVVRDGTLANADLRVSLRVNNRADSSVVVGCDDAASIPMSARGRGVLRLAGEEPRSVQFARASAADIALVCERWRRAPRPRRPWCAPLPARLEAAALAREGDAPCFGLVDRPTEQRQELAIHLPEAHGSLLVLGAPGSGKSTALRALALARSGVRVVPGELDVAWDLVANLVEHLDGGPEVATFLVLDDLDALVPRFTGEHRAAFVDSLARILREGPARGITAALGAQRIGGDLQSLASLVPGRLLLRHSSRQDFVLAGGDGNQHDPTLPAGRALWRGHWMQVLADAPPLPVAPPRSVRLAAPGRARAIVTTRAAHLLGRWPDAVALADAGPDPIPRVAPGSTIVGDVDEWQSRWGALTAVRAHAEVLFDGCTPADFRALTRSRRLPPPLVAGQCWRLNGDGTASRALLDP